MGQVYIQRFAYRDGVSKAAIEEARGEGFKAVARNGNWGDVETGITFAVPLVGGRLGGGSD